MKHCIIVKWNQLVKNKKEMVCKVKEAFADVVSFEGCSDVKVFENCNDRNNRYDLMIQIICTEKGLQIYDESKLHSQWKENYSQYIEKKVIFDYQD